MKMIKERQAETQIYLMEQIDILRAVESRLEQLTKGE